MAEPSPPPSNAGLRILLSKDRSPPSPPSTAVSSHADRDRIIVSTRSLSRGRAPFLNPSCGHGWVFFGRYLGRTQGSGFCDC